MKYKVLITGKSNSIIDDFFAQMNDNFEVMTTSSRYEDIIRHMNYFAPNIFVYCIYNESRDNISQMANTKYRLSQYNVPFALIGSKEDCDEFEKIAVNVSDLTLYRPMPAVSIQEKIVKFLDNRQRASGQLSAGMGSPVPAPATPITEKSSIADMLSSLEHHLSGAQVAASHRKHVLVVDDNSMMLKLIKEYLHDQYDVATAVSGKIAMKFLERKSTDLILLDYEMPEENGPAVLEKLRANPVTKDIPVIFLTGVTESKKIQEALILKPQGYLLKPIDREKLMDTITKLIG